MYYIQSKEKTDIASTNLKKAYKMPLEDFA